MLCNLLACWPGVHATLIGKRDEDDGDDDDNGACSGMEGDWDVKGTFQHQHFD